MKKINNTYIDNLVSKIISETLEERADSLVSKIKSNVNELGGMDDGHPRFGSLNLSKMSDKEIEALLNKPVRGGDDDDMDDEDDMSDILDYEDDGYDEFENEELDEKLYGNQSRIDKNKNRKIDGEDFKMLRKQQNEESEVCECGGGMYEGECMECGKSYMDEDIYDKEDLNGKFDYVQEEDDVDFEEEEYMDDQKDNSDPLGKTKEACNKNSENYSQETCNWFKQRFGSDKGGLDKFKFSMNEKLVGNQKRIDKNKNNKIDAEDFRMLRKESKKSKSTLKLSESEMIDLIEKIVLEDKEKVKSNIKNLTEPKGLTTYRRAVKGSGKENDDYIKSVAKKMKDYLKDGSKGDYETTPKHFPKNNGQLAKMDKMAYEVSKDGDEFLDDYMRPGMENLDYDEIHPNEDWMKDNIEGSSRTGNNPDWANAEETELGAKLNKKRKENKFAKAKRMAANKSPQPVVTDKPGQESGKGLDIKVESTELKTDKKLNEEFEKMKLLISYDRKTQ
jgi:hypothetical protein